jgi:Tfp pilus assembly protein PilF
MRPPLNPLEPRFIGAAVLVLAAAAALWRGRAKRPAWAAAGAVYAAILLPVSGVLQAGEQLVADRYSYLAALPFALLAGAGLRAAVKRPASRAAALLGAALAVAALGAAAVVQQSYWKTSDALWRRALDVDPVSPTALVNYGTSLVDAGRFREAADAFALALASDPACLPAEGDPVKLETRPVCRRALNNLGAARAQLGELPEARRLLRLAARAEPYNEGTRRNLARVEAALARGVSAP